MRIREEVGKYIQRLQALAQTLATVDVLQSFAVVAESQHLVRPSFTSSRSLQIKKAVMRLSKKKSWEPKATSQIVSNWVKKQIFS